MFTRRRIIFWINRVRLSFGFRRKGWFFEIIINEKYKNGTRYIKYVLTLISLLSALLILPTPFHAFGISLIIFFVLLLIEKMVFSYNNLFLFPLPTFKLEGEKWVGTSFGFAENPKNGFRIPIIGMVLTDEEYAKKIFSLIHAWNYYRYYDQNNNIVLSLVLDERKNEYIFFCYPNMAREEVNEYFRLQEQERKKESLTDIQQKRFCSLFLVKRHPITKTSYFPSFIQSYQENQPFLFQLQITPDKTPGPNTYEAPSTANITKYHLKIRKLTELTHKDIEYDLSKMY